MQPEWLWVAGAALLALSRDPPDVEALAEIVRKEPGLTAEVLRTANSAAFALSSPIASVQHAVIYLGMTTVQGIIAGAAAAAGLSSLPALLREPSFRRRANKQLEPWFD